MVESNELSRDTVHSGVKGREGTSRKNWGGGGDRKQKQESVQPQRKTEMGRVVVLATDSFLPQICIPPPPRVRLRKAGFP